MTLPASGALKMTDISGEFGDTAPYSLTEFYGVASGVPSSGAIKFSDFYGKGRRVMARSGSSAVTSVTAPKNAPGIYYHPTSSVGAIGVNNAAQFVQQTPPVTNITNDTTLGN